MTGAELLAAAKLGPVVELPGFEIKVTVAMRCSFDKEADQLVAVAVCRIEKRPERVAEVRFDAETVLDPLATLEVLTKAVKDAVTYDLMYPLGARAPACETCDKTGAELIVVLDGDDTVEVCSACHKTLEVSGGPNV